MSSQLMPVWKKEHYVEGAAEWVDCEGCAHHHQPKFSEQEYYSRQTRVPDFGDQGLLDRFGQVEPRVLFCVDGYYYNGKTIDSLSRLKAPLPDTPLALGGFDLRLLDNASQLIVSPGVSLSEPFVAVRHNPLQ